MRRAGGKAFTKGKTWFGKAFPSRRGNYTKPYSSISRPLSFKSLPDKVFVPIVYRYQFVAPEYGMNAWANDCAHFDIGGNTPFNPVWNYTGTISDIKLPMEMDNGQAQNLACFASQYARATVMGSAISVKVTTNQGYTESTNLDILGNEASYVKDILFGIRTTNNFEDLDRFIHSKEDMNTYGFVKSAVTKHGHGRVRGYASSLAVLEANKYQMNYDYRLENNNPTQPRSAWLNAAGSMGVATAASAVPSEQTPYNMWCWSIYFRPNLLLQYLDAYLNTPPILFDITLTYYTRFTHPTFKGPLQRNAAVATFVTPTPAQFFNVGSAVNFYKPPGILPTDYEEFAIDFGDVPHP